MGGGGDTKQVQKYEFQKGLESRGMVPQELKVFKATVFAKG